MAIQNPVIVVPGVTASTLRDEYEVDGENLWSLFTKRYDRVSMHPDDLRYERMEPSRVRAGGVFSIPYEELIKELRHELSEREDRPTPVYPFAYDWRQPLERTEAALAAFISEVIDRTKLLPHYHRAGYGRNPKVDLIGHSMGGLVIAGCLERAGANARVGKVVSLGSPFRGSHESIMKVATGLAQLGDGKSASRERESARVTPSLYYLLPSFRGAFETASELPNSLFDVDAWQPGVLATIEEYIRLYGLERRNRSARARDLFAGMLSGAKAHRRRLERFRPAQAGLKEADWLCVVGVNEKTRVKLSIDTHRGKPLFDLSSAHRRNEWRDRDHPARRVETGDGTVPYAGARCSFIPPEQIVCVTDDDFGYWEFGDRIIEGPVGLHGLLPKMNLIHRLIAAHLTGKSRKGTWGRRAPDVPEGVAWDPPVKGLKEKDG